MMKAVPGEFVLFGPLLTLTFEERPSDAALMEQLAQREQRPLERLYNRYARAVYSLVRRITQHAASAEEIVQDVFLQLWRNAHLRQASRGGSNRAAPLNLLSLRE